MVEPESEEFSGDFAFAARVEGLRASSTSDRVSPVSGTLRFE